MEAEHDIEYIYHKYLVANHAGNSSKAAMGIDGARVCTSSTVEFALVPSPDTLTRTVHANTMWGKLLPAPACARWSRNCPPAAR